MWLGWDVRVAVSAFFRRISSIGSLGQCRLSFSLFSQWLQRRLLEEIDVKVSGKQYFLCQIVFV